MIYHVPPVDPKAPAVVIDIGNTSTALATWHEDRLHTPLTVPTGHASAFDEAYAAHLKSMSQGGPGATVICSVVPGELKRIKTYIHESQDKDALVVGEAVAFPIDVGVCNAQGTLGVDRVCTAAAAYEKLQTGCIIVDFGTAVTIDLVDDDGVFQGGAILPGLNMQFASLHEHTAVLPRIQRGCPDPPFGQNTIEAMQTGVCRGLAGAVRGLVEAYASHLNRWPQVIATGGDLSFMAPYCDFLDTLVEHLTLHGVGVAYRKHIGSPQP